MFHLNKPQWKKTGKVRWSVHYKHVCSIVSKVVCRGVTLETRSRTRQPVAIVAGRGFVHIEGDIAFITKKPHET